MAFIKAKIPSRITEMYNALHLLKIKQLIIPFPGRQVNLAYVFPAMRRPPRSKPRAKDS